MDSTSGREHVQQRRGGLGILVLLAFAGVVFVVFPARILECDAVMFAYGAIHNDPTFMAYPHHPAYNYMQKAASLIGQQLRPPLSPIYILQYVSMAAGLGGVYLLHRMLVRLDAGKKRALLFSGALLFSYGYWHYSQQADTHIISALLLIWTAWVVYRLLAKPTLAAGCLLGLSLGLATLIHQTNILMVAPLLLAFVIRRRQVRGVTRAAGAFIAVYAVVGILPYLLIGRYLAGAASPGEFGQWLLGTSTWGEWGAWRLSIVPATLVGLVRTFTGSHYLLGFQPLARLAQRLFPLASWQDEMAVAAGVPSWQRLTLLAIQLVIWVFTMRALAAGPGAWKRMFAANRAFAVFLLAWIAVLGGFFAWWAPERVDFWIAWFVPVILVIAVPGRQEAGTGHNSTLKAVAFLGGLFVVNFFGSIYPQSGPIAERDTEVAVALDAVVRKGDIVVSDCYFDGRASCFAESFERVNLLDTIVPRPAPMGGSIYIYKDGRSTGTGAPTAPVAEQARRALEARTLVRLDSLLAEASAGRHDVYLVMTPVSADPELASVYRDLVGFIGEHFDISVAVPARGGVRLRRIVPARSE